MIQNNWKYAGIVYDSLVDGDGIGATFFVQGCPHKCPFCQNPATWDFAGGKPFTKQVLDELFLYFKDGIADHLTMSGGDPLANLELTYYIVSKFKETFPNKKVWLYTGYTYEFLVQDSKYKAILELVDVLVDGRFIYEQRTLNLPFRGSANQRLIDIKKSLQESKVVLYSL